MKKLAGIMALIFGIAFATGSAVAEQYDDGLSKNYYEALKGKKIGFVPIGMGFDLTEGWFAGMQREAESLGYEIIVRDPNWSTERGAQALNSLIAEKVDVLIFHNLDMHAYKRLVQKAQKAGIYVIQVNLKSVANGDVYVGPDWYAIGTMEAEVMAKACGEGSGRNGKVAIIQGSLTTPASVIGVKGIEDTLKKKFPHIKVVSKQVADWDASKAHAITLTVLKQHPDLCGIFGIWDGEDVGIAAAVAEMNKQDQVFVISSGGGQRAAACENIASGNYDAYVSYDVPSQAHDLNDAIKFLLQSKPKPGSKPVGLYSPLRLITKESMNPCSCWTVEEVK